MPTLNLGPAGQASRICAHCMKSEGDGVQLQSCSRCKRSRYCSRECQRADWSNHKPTCMHNAQQLAAMRAAAEARAVPPGNDMPGHSPPSRKDERTFKRWVQVHRPAITWALSNALTLKETPSRCSSDMLLMNLRPTHTGQPDASIDIAKMFAVESLDVYSWSDMKEAMPEHIGVVFTQLEQQVQQTKEKGYHGLAVAMIKFPGGIMHSVPCTVDEAMTSLDYYPQWKERFMAAIEQGITF